MALRAGNAFAGNVAPAATPRSDELELLTCLVKRRLLPLRLQTRRLTQQPRQEVGMLQRRIELQSLVMQRQQQRGWRSLTRLRLLHTLLPPAHLRSMLERQRVRSCLQLHSCDGADEWSDAQAEVESSVQSSSNLSYAQLLYTPAAEKEDCSSQPALLIKRVAAWSAPLCMRSAAACIASCRCSESE